MNAALLFAALPRQVFVFVAMTGAATKPIAHGFHRKRFHGILLRVTDGTLQLRFIPDECVEVIFLPESPASVLRRMVSNPVRVWRG
jgi:hypothetical protein